MSATAMSKDWPDRRRHGFSLLEFVASLLLIAAIAVLSFPTYQDFRLHETVPDDIVLDDVFTDDRSTPLAEGPGEVAGVRPAADETHKPAAHQPVAKTEKRPKSAPSGKPSGTE